MRSADPPGTPGARRAPHPVDVALFSLALAASGFVLLWPSPPGEAPFPYADKLVHAVVFLALAWTGARVGLTVRALAVGLVAYAIASEVIQQALLPERSGDWTDAVADMVGAAVGLAVARSRRLSTGAR